MFTVPYKAPVNPEILRWARESLSINFERTGKSGAK